jgi:heme A synthase
MGWISRRIVGAIIFTVLTSILGAYAVSKGYITGEVTLSSACGALILGFSFLVSLAVTTAMKRKTQWKKAWEDYYANWYAHYYRR